MSDNESQRPEPIENADGGGTPRIVLRRSLGIAVAGVCIAAWIFLMRQAAADLLFAQAEYLNSNSDRRNGAGRPSEVDVSAAIAGLTIRAIELNPYHGLALVARARDLANAGRFEEAIQDARRADRLIVTPETLNQIGSIWLRLNDDRQARRAFAETLGIAPSNREALERLVSIAQTDRDIKRMLARLRELSGSYPYSPNTAYFWAQFWKEIAAATKLPVYYAAGQRASGLACNRPVPTDYTLFYEPRDMMEHYNYFMMGARGMNVPDTGEVFKPTRPVDPVAIGLRK